MVSLCAQAGRLCFRISKYALGVRQVALITRDRPLITEESQQAEWLAGWLATCALRYVICYHDTPGSGKGAKMQCRAMGVSNKISPSVKLASSVYTCEYLYRRIVIFKKNTSREILRHKLNSCNNITCVFRAVGFVHLAYSQSHRKFSQCMFGVGQWEK